MNPVYQKKYVIPFKKGISANIQKFVSQRGMMLPNISIDRSKVAIKMKNSLIQNSLMIDRVNKSVEHSSVNFNSNSLNTSKKQLQSKQMADSFNKNDYSHKIMQRPMFDKVVKNSKNRLYTKIKYFQHQPEEHPDSSGLIFKSMDSRLSSKIATKGLLKINAGMNA